MKKLAIALILATMASTLSVAGVELANATTSTLFIKFYYCPVKIFRAEKKFLPDSNNKEMTDEERENAISEWEAKWRRKHPSRNM